MNKVDRSGRDQPSGGAFEGTYDIHEAELLAVLAPMLSARVNTAENCKLAGIACAGTCMPITDVFTVRRARLLSQPPVLTSGLSWKVAAGKDPPILFGACVRRHKKQLNDVSQLRTCEEWCLFRRQHVRSADAVCQLEQFARPDPSLWLYLTSSLLRSAGSRCCHENVTQIEENEGKSAENSDKRRRK